MADAAAGVTRGVARAAFTIGLASAIAAGCSNDVSIIDENGVRRSWHRTGSDALFGPEASDDLDLALRCRPKAMAVEFEFNEAEAFSGSRPLAVRAGQSVFGGFETLDPIDAILISRMAVPLDHPVLSQIAGGTRQILFESAAGIGSLPAGPIPARMVRDCRTVAAGPTSP